MPERAHGSRLECECAGALWDGPRQCSLSCLLERWVRWRTGELESHNAPPGVLKCTFVALHPGQVEAHPSLSPGRIVFREQRVGRKG